MRTLLLIAGLMPVAFGLQAQSTRVNGHNANAWFMYFGNHKITNRIGLHAEAQLRRSDVISDWQQLLLRTGIDLYAGSARYTVGYAFVRTYPYGEFPVAAEFNEHRAWQQMLVSQGVGKIKLSHRYRLEQRWIGSSALGGFSDPRFENRARYMVRANLPFSGDGIEKGKFYASAYDEIFLNFGKDVAYNIFDQNRAYLALGFHLGKPGRIEVGYLHQLVQQRKLRTTPGGELNVIENNNTFQVAFISDFSFMKQN